MMWQQLLNFVVSIIPGLGLGFLVSAWLIRRWEKKKLIYQTKLKVYSRLIKAYQEHVAKKDDENLRQLFVCYQKQVELIAPIVIVSLSRKFYQSSSEDTPYIRDELVNAMRKDLDL